jgi:hypothetical protein
VTDSEPRASALLAPRSCSVAQSLRDAQQWGGTRADPAQPRACLRSGLLPRLWSAEPEPFLLGDPTREDLVDWVINDRRSRVALQTETDTEHRGRLLAYWPDDEDFCGVSETESQGFLDSASAPPWDTWVALLYDASARSSHYWGTALIAWVPDVFVPAVEAGILVHPMDAVAWLDGAPSSLQKLWNDVSASRE